MTDKIFSEKTYNLLGFIGTLIILAIYALNNISEPSLWFDEAVQFWYSNGISCVSRPLTPVSFNIFDVIKINATHNMDPGGFTLSSFIFALFNDSIEWLRLYPYLFFTLSVFALIGITKELSGSLKLGFFAGFLFFILPVSNLILDFAFELRAYSMEACGVLTCFYLLLRTFKAPTERNLFFFGIASVFFIGSRYSFWIFCFVASLGLIMFGFNKSIKSFLSKGYLYYLPVGLIAIFYLAFAFYSQVFLMKFTYHYSDYAILGYQNLYSQIAFFLINFFSRHALPITLFIISYAFIKFNKNLTEKVDITKFDLLFFTVVLYESIFIALSWMKIHPWLITARWSIGLSSITLICASGFLSMLYLLLKNTDLYKKIKDNSLIAITSLIVIFSLSFTMIKDRKIPVKDTILQAVLDLEKNDENFFNYTFYIPTNVWAIVKYQFEFGQLSGKKYRKIYPDNFVIAFPEPGNRFDIEANLESFPQEKLKTVDVVLFTAYRYKNPHIILDKMTDLTSNKFKVLNENIAVKQ